MILNIVVTQPRLGYDLAKSVILEQIHGAKTHDSFDEHYKSNLASDQHQVGPEGCQRCTSLQSSHTSRPTSCNPHFC